MLLSRGGDVKVGDFGLAADVAGSTKMSRSMTRVGTTNYFSPELGQSLQGSVRANDMWALGCIILELLRRLRLDGAIWSSDPEMVAKRSSLLSHALAADNVLGAAAALMLVVKYRRRCSAAQLLRLLDPLQAAVPPQVTIQTQPRCRAVVQDRVCLFVACSFFRAHQPSILKLRHGRWDP